MSNGMIARVTLNIKSKLSKMCLREIFPFDGRGEERNTFSFHSSNRVFVFITVI